MTDTERLRRPVPERTRPNRNILGALSQTDGRANGKAGGFGEAGMHPLGPGFGEAAPNGQTRRTADRPGA